MSQQATIRQDILINAPVNHVWQLVATEEGLCQWWGNTIHLEAKEGGRCEEWRAIGQEVVHWQGVVTLYAPPHELLMTLRAQPQPTQTLPIHRQSATPELTTISISLKAEGNHTRVHVTQRAFGPATAITTSPMPDAISPSAYPSVPMSQLTQAPPNQPSSGVQPMRPPTSIYANEPGLIQQMQQQWQQRVHHLAQLATSQHSTSPTSSIDAV